MKNFTNQENNGFYSVMPIQDFVGFSKTCGLTQCCDVNAILPLITDADSILEVGGGYGRVLDFLMDNTHKPKLFAIEKNEKLYRQLATKFAKRATVIHGDILTDSLDERFDVVLILWSSISEFSFVEQAALIAKASQLLRSNGKLFFDVSLMPKHTHKITGNSQTIETPYGTLHGYFPSTEDVQSYAREANFVDVDHFVFDSDVGLKRTMFMLSKA